MQGQAGPAADAAKGRCCRIALDGSVGKRLHRSWAPGAPSAGQRLVARAPRSRAWAAIREAVELPGYAVARSNLGATAPSMQRSSVGQSSSGEARRSAMADTTRRALRLVTR